MINLDQALASWTAATAGGAAVEGWGPQQAKDVADQTAAEAGYAVLWEPGDEEWILLADKVRYQGMLSINYPLALLTADAGRWLRGVDADVDIVEITDFLDENLSATPGLLRSTALPHGWDDDFDPSAFCANDLFVESV